MPYLGYHPTGQQPQAFTLLDEALAYVANASSGDGWAYAMEFAIGPPNPSNVPSVRGYIFSADSSGVPTTMLGSTATFGPTTQKTSGTNGTFYTRNLAAAVKITAGGRYCPVVHAVDHDLVVGEAGAGDLPGRESYYFFWDEDGSIPLASTFDVDRGPSYEGHAAVSILYKTNVAPNKPVITSPDDGDILTDATPTIVATFSDPDETMPNGLAADTLRKCRIIVSRVSNGAVMWDSTYDVTDDEQSDGVSTRIYKGDALSEGVSYRIAVYHYDRHLKVSPRSDYVTFSLNSGGSLTPTGPTGKETTLQPGPFTATWTHPGGLNGKSAVVRLRQGSKKGAVARSMATYKAGLSIAPGGTLSLSWVDTGFTNLVPGTRYYPEFKMIDTANVESGWYVADTPFSINAVPATPSGLTPNNGAPSTDYPTLTATATDADDTPAGNLQVRMQLLSESWIATNASFEAGDASNWTATTPTAGVTAVCTFDASYGTAPGSGKIAVTVNSGGAGGIANFRNDSNIPCYAGFPATFSARCRTSNVNVIPRLRFYWYDATDTLISTTGATNTGPALNTWQDYTFTATAPATALYFRMGVFAYCLTPGATGNVNLDDLVVGDGVRWDLPMTYRTGSAGLWDRVMNSTRLPFHGDFRWRAYSYDGIWYSGSKTTPATTPALAAKSAEAEFSYVDGPAVTISDPLPDEALVTASISVQWSVDGTQHTFRVKMWSGGAVVGEPLYDSLTQTGDDTQWFIPGGWTLNLHTYTVVVYVNDNLGFEGISNPISFMIDYYEPTSMNGMLVTPYLMPFDVEASAAMVEWEASTDPDFDRYLIHRRPSGTTIGSALDIVVGEVGDQETLAFIDATPASYQPYVWSLSQVTRIGADELESARIEFEFQVNFNATIIQRVEDPTQRVVLIYRGERRRKIKQPRTIIEDVWGANAPVMLVGSQRYQEFTCEYKFWEIDPDGMYDEEAVFAKMTALDSLYFINPVTPHTLLYRDRRRSAVTGHITNEPEYSDPSLSYVRAVTLTFTELESRTG